MKIKLNARFIKQYEKAPQHVQAAFDNRLQLFVKNQRDPVLNNHKLKHEWQGHRSINVTGDWRAIFYGVNGLIVFRAIGTHSQLYKR